MKEILTTIENWIEAGDRCVLVTIIQIIGSSPRDLGTSMLVRECECVGSIGGGNLEYRAVAQARELLSNSSNLCWYDEFFGLGPALNQCCGGAVKLLFEVLSQEHSTWIKSALAELNQAGECRIVTDMNRQSRYVYASNGLLKQVGGSRATKNTLTAVRDTFVPQGSATMRVVSADECYLVQRVIDDRSPLALFGAGHVGKAIVQAFAALPFRIDWIDQRADMFPEPVPDNVKVCCVSEPVSLVDGISTDAFCLVMTHSHQLDYELCKHVLNKGDDVWLGLIGSITKRRRFEQRLLKDGITQRQLNRLICPIGISGISNKHPSAIAASVAAQLLQEREIRLANRDTQTSAASA